MHKFKVGEKVWVAEFTGALTEPVEYTIRKSVDGGYLLDGGDGVFAEGFVFESRESCLMHTESLDLRV